MYADRLTADGYDVLVAGDGLEALSILRTQVPSLILLDLVMPQMSGLEVMEVIARDPRLSAIPVLILSNLGQDSDIERGMSLGAVDYLIKNDARPADVSLKIRSILSRSTASVATDADVFRLVIRDREVDADRFVDAKGLPRRFWCPACEVELTIELVPQPSRPGWYDAHFICPSCGREY
jgi:DNA-binding response OmpR family regulator